MLSSDSSLAPEPPLTTPETHILASAYLSFPPSSQRTLTVTSEPLSGPFRGSVTDAVCPPRPMTIELSYHGPTLTGVPSFERMRSWEYAVSITCLVRVQEQRTERRFPLAQCGQLLQVLLHAWRYSWRNQDSLGTGMRRRPRIPFGGEVYGCISQGVPGVVYRDADEGISTSPARELGCPAPHSAVGSRDRTRYSRCQGREHQIHG